ncbi:hypothetical protein PR048_029394 [Dryococelus australis]|uniref:Uncharacterized protein n=1 Tax=Dryococelus australis TaxID=614101 RepID=A0ABQ9GFT5_9NEOP|nr:hypothetical protein PR048_029394 [Dryococelus australis]
MSCEWSSAEMIGRGGTGDPRENPPIGGTVRARYSHLRKSVANPVRGFPPELHRAGAASLPALVAVVTRTEIAAWPVLPSSRELSYCARLILPALHFPLPSVAYLGEKDTNNICNMNSARQDKSNPERMTQLPQSIPELKKKLTVLRSSEIPTWRLHYPPPTKANRVRYPAGSLQDFRMWESCRTMPLFGGFSRGSPVFPALAFRRCSILTSITLIGPNLFTHRPIGPYRTGHYPVLYSVHYWPAINQWSADLILTLSNRLAVLIDSRRVSATPEQSREQSLPALQATNHSPVRAAEEVRPSAGGCCVRWTRQARSYVLSRRRARAPRTRGATGQTQYTRGRLCSTSFAISSTASLAATPILEWRLFTIISLRKKSLPLPAHALTGAPSKHASSKSHQYTQNDTNIARQFRALRLAAMGDLMRVAVSPLTLPRLSASNAEKSFSPNHVRSSQNGSDFTSALQPKEIRRRLECLQRCEVKPDAK